MKGNRADPPPRILLRPLAPSGFLLEGADGAELAGTLEGEALRVVGAPGHWEVRRSEASGGYVLFGERTEGAGLEELGRISPWNPSGEPSFPVSLLLGDGRLFSIGLCPEPGLAFQLTGWETPGAYWIARGSAAAWQLEMTPAGREARIGWEALVLFAVALRPFLGVG